MVTQVVADVAVSALVKIITILGVLLLRLAAVNRLFDHGPSEVMR